MDLLPRFLLLCLIFSCIADAQIFYNSSTKWAVRNIDTANRISDSIGTALRLQRLGPLKQFQVVFTLRSGPAADVLRDSLKKASEACIFNASFGCDISYGGAGNIGEVQYSFHDDVNNREGTSSQTMIACKCLGKECKEAILLQPFRIVEDSRPNSVVRDTCLYQRVIKTGQFSECHTELLRLSARKRHSLEELNEDISRAYLQYATHPWVYNVTGSGWLAYGQRGWKRKMNESDFNSKRTINFTEIASYFHPKLGSKEKADNLFHFASNVENDKQPEMEFVRDEKNEDGELCAEIYKSARKGGAWIGSQDDEIAIGRFQSTYFINERLLISSTELALASSAAALGTYTVWMIHFKFMKKERTKVWNLVSVLIAQVLLFTLESAPLLFALLAEYQTEKWATQFAHVDGTLAIGDDMEVGEQTAVGSVYVATAVIGQVWHISTNVKLVLMLLLVFSIATLSGIVATIIEWRHCRKQMEEGKIAAEYEELLYLNLRKAIKRDAVWKAFEAFEDENEVEISSSNTLSFLSATNGSLSSISSSVGRATSP